MNDDQDDPYRPRTEEELARLPEYWWHSWLIDPIRRGDLPAVQQYLARRPEGLYMESPSHFDPFIVAAQQPDPAALRLLLQHWAVHPTPGAPPPDERGASLLHVACGDGALEAARYLLDEQQPALALLHARSAYGRTPLLDAAAPNLITGGTATGVARFLCTDLDASGRPRGRGGETPLHRLCHHGRPP